MSDTNKIIDGLTKKLADEGKLVEAGFQAYRMFSIPSNAPDIQVSECRLAYFFGAQHLFASIIGIVVESAEPTEDDIRRLGQINAELESFVNSVKGESG